jgi:hypothetical protein
MTTTLPLVAAVLALIAAFISDPLETEEGKDSSWGLLVWIGVLIAAAFIAVIAASSYSSQHWYAACGFGAGAVASWLAGRFKGGWALGLALGAMAAGFANWVPIPNREFVQLGLVAGGAVGSWLAIVFGARNSSSIFTIGVAGAVGVDFLAKTLPNPNGATLGTLLLVLAAAACLLPRLVKASAVTSVALGFVILAVGAFVVGQQVMGVQNIWILYLAGLLAGLASFWFLPDREDAPVPTLLAVILAIGLATVAFGLQRGAGMALSLLGAISALALLRHPRGLLAFAPLAALVFYRVFRENHTAAARALDIGQHYALIGLALGLVLPLIAIEWWRARTASEPARLQIAGVLWVVMLLAAPIAVGIVMGSKGVVGLVAGVGFAGVVELLRGGRSLQSLSLALGLSAATTAVYGWMGDLAQLSREEKMAMLIPLMIVLAVAFLLISLISPRVAKMSVEVPS